MKINGATNGLPLYKWAKGLSPEELVKTDWLNKATEEIPIEELANYNPVINMILILIIETKNNMTDQMRDKQLAEYERQLKKEKIFALISKDAKENLSN